MKHFCLYFLVLLTSSVGAKTKLEYRLAVGDTFSVRQVAKQHITQDINGVDQIIENDLTAVMRFEVVKATVDNYTIAMSFKRLKMLMSSPTLGTLSNADTNSTDSSDVTTMLFKGLLNFPVTIVMARTGNIESASGGEQLIENMFASAGIDQPDIIEASKAPMEKQFGSAALSNSLEQMTFFYPLDKVAIGKEWINNYVGDLNAKTTWKLDAISEQSLSISGVASTTMSTIDDNVSMTLSGSQMTSIRANPINGLFQDITVVGENSGVTLLNAQNLSIPTVIKSTITYKIL